MDRFRWLNWFWENQSGENYPSKLRFMSSFKGWLWNNVGGYVVTSERKLMTYQSDLRLQGKKVQDHKHWIKSQPRIFGFDLCSWETSEGCSRRRVASTVCLATECKRFGPGRKHKENSALCASPPFSVKWGHWNDWSRILLVGRIEINNVGFGPWWQSHGKPLTRAHFFLPFLFPFFFLFFLPFPAFLSLSSSPSFFFLSYITDACGKLVLLLW